MNAQAPDARRVLHIINGESYAGAERVQDLLSAALPPLGYEMGFASIKPGAFDTLRNHRDAPLHKVPMRSRLDLSVVPRIAALVRRDGYCALHTHTVRNAMIGRAVAALTRVPVFHHVHSPVRADTEHGLRNRINAFVDERIVQPGAVRLIPVSDSLRQYLLQHGARAERIRVVPNGVPTRVQHFDWRPPAGEWTVGAMALFRPRKGLDTLIRALAQLRNQGLPVRLLAVGAFETPAYENEIRALVAASSLQDHVEWAGFTRNVDGALSRMNLFVLPSHYGEGMPMVLLEALACGLPVIGTDMEGVPEVLDGGRAGRLVPPARVDALAAAIAGTMADPAQTRELARRGHQRQREVYSDVAMARSVAAIYDEVLKA